MKKLILTFFIFCVGFQVYAQQVPEKFVRDLDKISSHYSKDMHDFLSTLAPNTAQFDLNQQSKYCAIVGTYINDFYTLIDKNRNSLPFSYANMTKADVVLQVKSSKEMQILEKYNIQCDLN